MIFFFYWNQTGLNKIICADCQKKWDGEYKRLRKDEHHEVEEQLKTEEAAKEKIYHEEAKRRGVVNCLYSYFKNAPKKLKIICDWDEVIQTLEPKVYYELSEREGAYYDAPWWMPNGTKFEQWFKNFWLNPPIYFSDYGSHSIYSDKSMVNSCLKKGNCFALGSRSIKSKIEKIKNETDFYEKTPFLTIAKELLRLIKENKIEQIIFLSAYNKKDFADSDPRKMKIFSETFGKFPNCSLNLIGFDSEGQSQTKGEWIKKMFLINEVVIDDNPNILSRIIESNDKVIAIAPFYPATKHHKKVLLITNSISDLKKEDFTNKLK